MLVIYWSDGWNMLTLILIMARLRLLSAEMVGLIGKMWNSGTSRIRVNPTQLSNYMNHPVVTLQVRFLIPNSETDARSAKYTATFCEHQPTSS